MLLVLMWTAHWLAVVLVVMCVRPGWVVAALISGISLSLTYESRRILRLEISAISISAHGEFMVQRWQGHWVVAEVSGDSVVSPLVTVLGIRLPNRRFAKRMLLLPDMLDARQYRQLRVWLKWYQNGAKTLEQETH